MKPGSSSSQYICTETMENWISLDSENAFRIEELGKMSWVSDINFSTHLVSVCPAGGLIAVYAYTRGFLNTSERNENHVIALYTSLGEKNSCYPEISLDLGDDVTFMSWNEFEDHLIVCFNSGKIQFYSCYGLSVSPSITINFIPTNLISTSSGVAGFFDCDGKLSIGVVEYVPTRGVYELSSIPISSELQQMCGRAVLLSFPFLRNSDSSAIGNKSFCSQLYAFYPSGEDSTNVCLFTFSGPNQNNTSPSSVLLIHELDVSLNGIVSHAVLSPSGKNIAFLTCDGNVYWSTVALEVVVLIHLSVCSLKNIFPKPAVSFSPLLFCGEEAVLVEKRFVDDQGTLNDYESDLLCCSFLLVKTGKSSSENGITEVDIELPREAMYIPECDGVRIVSQNQLLFLQAIPQHSLRVFSLGSVSSGAVLRLAYDGFVSGDAAAIQIMSQFQHDPASLLAGIDDCIHAAAHEWHIETQKKLLRAVNFGKLFCSSYDPDLFVSTATEMRVRNTLLLGKPNMALSHSQLHHMGMRRLVRRVVCSGNFSLAWIICESLRCLTDDIRSEWVIAKLKHDITMKGFTEDESANSIVEFLRSRALNDGERNYSGSNSHHFTELATVAQIHGKRKAALVLLNAERVAARQIPMLLAFDEPERALKRAVAAADCDLLFTVMQYLIRAGGGSRELQWIIAEPDARHLLLLYIDACPHYRYFLQEYLHSNPKLEQYIYLQDYLAEDAQLGKAINRNLETIEDLCTSHQTVKSNLIEKAFVSTSSSTPVNPGGEGEGRHFASPTSATSSVSGISGGTSSGSTISERFLRLQPMIVRKQTLFATRYNDKRFLRASISDMICLLFQVQRKGEGKALAEEEAQTLRREFNVPDDMFQWCRLRAFAATEQWESIDHMGGVNTKLKPVIGGEAIVSLLLSHQRFEQAAKHISRIPQLEERLEYYIQCGEWLKAGEDCARMGNEEYLSQLKIRAKGNGAIQEQIQRGWDSVISGHSSATGLSFGKFFS